MNNCIFCRIIGKEIPSFIVYEDENFLAFLDIRPWTEGHTLLVPKNHSEYLFDMNEKAYEELMKKTKNLAILLKRKMNVRRIGVAVEGFEVNHVHVHLIPMNSPSDFNPKNAKSTSIEELKKVYEKLKNL